MNTRFAAFVFIFAALNTTALAQTKIGVSVESVLTTSPSARANGMGEAGVALIDCYSPFFNPAGVAFLQNAYYARLSFFPEQAQVHPVGRYQGYFSLSTNLMAKKLIPDLSFVFNFAYYRTRLGTDPIPITTYDEPEGTGEYYVAKDIVHNFAFGIGISKKLDLSFGVTGKWIKEGIYSISNHGYGFDAGLLLGWPMELNAAPGDSEDKPIIRLNPRLGSSWSNVGPDIEHDDSTSKSVLPRLWRFGMATEFLLSGLISGIRTDLISILPAAEVETRLLPYAPDDSRFKIGCEAGLAETLFLRFGQIHDDGPKVDHTWGFGIHSQGIARLIMSVILSPEDYNTDAIARFFAQKLQLEFEFARNSRKVRKIPTDEVYHNTDYYGISVSL